MLISSAFAQDAGGAASLAGGIQSFLPLILIFAVFYFLLIRPQQKKMKTHKAMLDALRRGDTVVTGGGIIGSVVKVIDEHEVTVEIADGVKVRVQRQSISAVVSKPEPVNRSGAGTTPANDTAKTAKGGLSGLKKLLSGKDNT